MSSTPRELTLRGVLLGCALTALFTAANVYLGLKIGLTFATSIPAAVISMAVLRSVRAPGILENNIVQTVASAAGTLASVIFVLPGLVIVGWWSGFPFWTTAGVCALGGLLGVMFSIPLRRALVTRSSLPFPEGVAAAEILKVGDRSTTGAAGNREDLRVIVVGTVLSAGFALLTATRLLVAEISSFFRIGPAATGMAGGLSFALIGAGHLVGLTVGLAMLAGVFIAWGVATPLLTGLQSLSGEAATVAQAVWATQVRLIGAGAIGVAALWTLVTLLRPMVTGLFDSFGHAHARSVDRLSSTERDLPANGIVAIVLASLVPIALLLHSFLAGGPLQSLRWPLVIAALVFILLAGFAVAAVCGYMAGLIGASNSPLSGVGILAVIAAALLLGAFIRPEVAVSARGALVAFALLVTALVFAVATIANDNLQDLKTGHLVGATPWRQQVALIIGVAAGAVVIPPVLDLLDRAYGFAGVASAGPQALPAPQATLIAALARGVLGEDLDWRLIGVGAAIGAAAIYCDVLLRRAGRSGCPPLAVGMGIYLPMATTLTVFFGALLGRLYERWLDQAAESERARRLGTLLASGLIVGESLFGVLLAGVTVATSRGTPIALVDDGFEPTARVLGPVAFVLLVAHVYRWLARRARQSA